MTEPLNAKQVDRLIAAYVDGSLSAAALPIFERWLHASPENPRRVARLSITDFGLREVCQDTKADYLLDVLNQIDDAAGPVQPVTLHHLKQPTWHRYRLPLALGGAIAAVLVIAAALIITLQGPGSVPDSIADTTTPNKPGESAQPILRDTTPIATPVVAKITAEHNAAWDRQPDEYLRPGDRLTLTAGFAEITTNRGAIAILEAPATIELTDNDNALRLHSGKLVGICETESSKGFLVRTPHMDVIDLGTRFGVDASKTDVNEVHLFEGEVEVSNSSSASTESGTVKVLQAGQALRVRSGSSELALIEMTPAPFTAIDRWGAVQLVATGFNQSFGDTDHYWRVVAADGQPVMPPAALIVSQHQYLTVPAESPSRWLMLEQDLYSPDSNEIEYTCRREFTVPSRMDPATTTLVIRCIADHDLMAVRVNNQPIAFEPYAQRDATLDLPERRVVELRSENLSPGINTIEIDIREIKRNGLNVSGLRAEFEFETQAKGKKE
ncbi:MAG: FecR domain-containing protein [Phycisphaerae bacterium]